jgi:hypothetical protein
MQVVTASIKNVRTRVVAQKYIWVPEEDRYILCIRKSEFVFISFDTDIDSARYTLFQSPEHEHSPPI